MDLDEKRAPAYNAYVLNQELNEKRQQLDEQMKKEMTDAENRGYERYRNSYARASRVNTSRSYASKRAMPILIASIIISVLLLLAGITITALLVVGIIVFVGGIILYFVITSAIVNKNKNKIKNFENNEEKNKKNVAKELDNIELRYIDKDKKIFDDYQEVLIALEEEQNAMTGQKMAKIVDNNILEDMFNFFVEKIDERYLRLHSRLFEPDFINSARLEVSVCPMYVELSESDGHVPHSVKYVFKDHGLEDLPDYPTERAVALITVRYFMLYLLDKFPQNSAGLFNSYSTDLKHPEYKTPPYPDYDFTFGAVICNSVKNKPEW